LIASAQEAEQKQKWDVASADLYQAIDILQSIRSELTKHSREVPAVERMVYAHFPPEWSNDK